MVKVKYYIHHQAIVICPKCDCDILTDLGEDDLADGVEVKCSFCGTSYELEGRLD